MNRLLKYLLILPYFLPHLLPPPNLFEGKFLNNRVEPALANAQRKAGPEPRLFTVYIGSNYSTADNKHMKGACARARAS